jgi:subtilisin family serine protease
MRKSLFLAALVAGVLVVQAPAVAQEDDPLQWEHMPDQLFVKFQPNTDESVIAAINGVIGGQVAQTFRLDADLRLIKFGQGSDLREAIEFYRVQAEVDYVHPDYIHYTQIVPDDARFGELWGMHNTGQSGGLYDFDIDGPEAWDVHTDASAIVIGSIDTGVDKNHEDLLGNIWTNPGEIAGNGIDDDNNGYIDDINGWDFAYNDNNPADGHSHGTHTMGTSAGMGNNGIGVAGVTWTAQIMILKACTDYGSCPESATIPAIDYATENGAHITSNSWGGGGCSQTMQDAIERANQAGVLFSAAAGNNSSDIEYTNFCPAGFPNENIISVAAMNRYGNKAGFSNWGATRVDLGAPGDTILSTTPNNGYGNKSGTSMACPHVTGAVALIMGYNPTLDYLAYKQIIMDSVVPNAGMAGRCVTGGVLNARSALDITPPVDVPPENEPPVADAGGSYKGRAWTPVTFDGSASSDPNEPGGSGVDLNDYISSYTWDFGDGSQVTTSSPTVTHAYPFGNADYTVTLTVKDKYRIQSGNVSSTVCKIRGGGRKVK